MSKKSHVGATGKCIQISVTADELMEFSHELLSAVNQLKTIQTAMVEKLKTEYGAGNLEDKLTANQLVMIGKLTVITRLVDSVSIALQNEACFAEPVRPEPKFDYTRSMFGGDPEDAARRAFERQESRPITAPAAGGRRLRPLSDPCL